MMCPVCNSRSGAPLCTTQEYTVLLCSECGLRYSDPMRAASKEWYESAQCYSPVHQTQRRKSPREILRQQWRYRQFVVRVPPRKNLRLLDVGCGLGEFVYVAQCLGYQASGIDFDSMSVLRGRELYDLPELQVGAIKDLLVSNPQQYDGITLFDVLEHLENPSSEVAMMARLLSTGGYLGINVPGWPRWPRVLSKSGDYPPHHLTLWSERALRHVLEEAGLVVTAIVRKPLAGSDLFDALRGWWPWLEGPSVFKKILRQALWKGIFVPLAFGLRPVPGSGGFAVFALAQKP